MGAYYQLPQSKRFLTRRPPETLYHYTCQRGLLGIIENRELWATQIQFLSDAQEFIYAHRLMQEELEKRRAATDEDVIRGLEGDLKEESEQIEYLNVCVASFSEQPDLLSQWRGYCPSNGGYAVGFAASTLIPDKRYPNFTLAPCIYDDEQQRVLVNELIDVLASGKPGDRAEVDRLRYNPFAGDLSAVLAYFSPIFKHPKFREEEEWRLISRPMACTSAGFAYRVGTSMVTPYYKYSLDTDSEIEISSVWVGPTPHPKSSQTAVQSLLIAKGMHNVDVHLSSLPYRTW